MNDRGADDLNAPEIWSSGIHRVRFGRDVRIVEPVNLYGCRIGDESFIGPFVEIQGGATIGRRCRIQSHSFICEKVTLGDDCFVGHGVMFINDRFRAGRPTPDDPAALEPTTIGDRVSIGSNCTILPVRICAGAVLGAGSVITRDIVEPGVYAGNPARKLRDLPD